MALTAKQAAFIKTVAPIIQRLAKERGYQVVSPIIAQACLESGYGTSGLAKYHNYHGLKCGPYWKGKSVNMKTKEEYSPGTLTTISDNFRAFDSMEEGLKGYFDFISTKRYANLKTATTPKRYLELIKADKYATDSNYVQKNMKVVTDCNLTIYDDLNGAAATATATTDRKSVEEIAREVLGGKWGNGADRKNRLQAAGYDYAEVQAMVNRLVKK